MGAEPLARLTLGARPRAAVMRPERPFGRIDPAVGSRAFMRFVPGIANSVFRFGFFAHHDQTHLFVRVVEEGVADSRSGRESNAVARLKRIQNAIDPGIGLARNDENKFFLRALGMRIARTASR